MKELQELALLLQRHRRAAGLSLQALADASKVPKSVIGRLELAEVRAPTPDTLTKLARALGIEVEAYFTLAGYSTPHGLPELPLYLRAKYGVDAATAEAVAEYFDSRRQQEHTEPDDQAA